MSKNKIKTTKKTKTNKKKQYLSFKYLMINLSYKAKVKLLLLVLENIGIDLVKESETNLSFEANPDVFDKDRFYHEYNRLGNIRREKYLKAHKDVLLNIEDA